MNNISDINILEKSLGIELKKKELLVNALTHRSYLNETKKEELTSNERMEFLGDSILSFWVASRIYQKFPSFPEGKLTFIKTHLVRTETLAKMAEKLQLGQFMLMSKGEELGGGRKNTLLLANCFEAVTGAIFLDGGIQTVSLFLEKQINPVLEEVENPDSLKDNKSLLQEKIQAKGNSSPIYKLVSAVGPDHSKIFTMAVYSEDKLLAEGSGASKQEAEEQAAKKALEIFCA